ncbi:MAG: HAD-IIB family hydrolase [Thermodesulfobacteriota bacterium]|nr:HAD-IIB family hydrolase [Thermodesulfobacteriota bacterium]
MENNSLPRVPQTPFFVILTDLDGTLLDNETYGWKDAQPALDLCKRLRVPVVLVSSKTRAEMDVFHLELSLSAPFISENGGGIFFPGETFSAPAPGRSLDKGLWKCSIGLTYNRLVRGLQEIRDELGWNIKGFSDMDVEEISRLTGLDRETSHLAAMREFDEPFIIIEQEAPDLSALFRAAAQRGMMVTVGGRFYHLKGKNDKGRSAEKVISWYKKSHGEVVSVALGDSPNDFPMLERVDYPVLIRSQRDFPTLKKTIPRLRVTREMGPKGWNSAVLDILKTRE